MAKRNGYRRATDPTPRQIKRATQKIRESWTERTFYLRSGYSPDAADKASQWTAPVLSEDEWLSVMKEHNYGTPHLEID